MHNLKLNSTDICLCLIALCKDNFDVCILGDLGVLDGWTRFWYTSKSTAKGLTACLCLISPQMHLSVEYIPYCFAWSCDSPRGLTQNVDFLHGPQGHNQIRHAGAQTVASQFPCCWLDRLYASVVCSLEFGKAQQRSVGRDTTTWNTKTGLTIQVGKLVLPTMTPFDFKSNHSVHCRHTPDNILNKTLTEKSHPFHAKVLTLLYFSVPAKGW